MSADKSKYNRWYLFWQAVAHYSRKFKFVFLGLGFVTLVVSAYFTVRLPIETDLGKLLPENTSSVKDLRYLEKMLGGIGFFVVVFEVDEPNEKRLKNLAIDFSALVKSDSFLSQNTYDIYHEMPTGFMRSHGMLYLDIEDLAKISYRLESKIKYERRKLNPYLIDIENTSEVKFHIGDILQKYRKKYPRSNFFIDKEKRRIAVFIKPRKTSTDIAFNQRFYEQLKKSLRTFDLEKDLKYHITGRYMLELEQNRIIGQDIGRTTILTTMLLMTLLVLFFKSMRAAFVIGLPLFTGLMATFALSYLIIGRVNLISAFLTAILLGLGIDYGVHLFSRYKDERLQDKGITDSITSTMASILSSIGLGALTTAAAFLTLAFSSFRAFAEFGLIAFLGVISTLVSFAIFVPALLFFTERYSNSVTPMVKMVSENYRVSKARLIILSLISIAGFALAYQINFEYNFSKLDAASESVDRADEVLSNIVESHGSPIVYISDSLDELKIFSQNIENENSVYAGFSQNLLSFFPKEPAKKRLYVEKINKMLRAAKIVVNANEEPAVFQNIVNGIELSNQSVLKIEKIPDQIQKLFIGEDDTKKSRYFHYLYPAGLESARRGVIDFASEFRYNCRKPVARLSLCKDEDKSPGISDSLILSDILDNIMRDIRNGSIFIALTVILFIILLSRSFSGSLLIGLPLLMGIGITFFMLVSLSWMFDSIFFRFNYINSLAMPLLLGVGIDNGFHLYRHYRENGMRDIHKVMSETGNAVLLSNLTTMIGFGSLTLSNHPGLASLGFMAALGILSICASYFTLFPVMAAWQSAKNR